MSTEIGMFQNVSLEKRKFMESYADSMQVLQTAGPGPKPKYVQLTLETHNGCAWILLSQDQIVELITVLSERIAP